MSKSVNHCCMATATVMMLLGSPCVARAEESSQPSPVAESAAIGNAADSAAAEEQKTSARAPSLSTGPGLQGLPLLPRGGGGDEIYAGDPTCIPKTNTIQVGITSVGVQQCGDGQWDSLAYPVLTGGATIESINIIHNTNSGSGDLYLMGDCGNNPDTNNILWTGCSCIEGAVPGAVTNYCIGDPLVDPPAKTWVVAVFRSSFSFDIAFDCLQDGPNQAFGNLVGSGNCGDWVDLDGFAHGNDCNPGGTFGGCAWVSLVTAGSPGVPECCDSPALCDGDANGDGVVDPLDSGAILSRFGLDASDPANCQYDVNCDGQINPLDTGYVLSRFGTCEEPVDCPLGGGVPGECGGPTGCGDQCGETSVTDCCEVHSEPGCDAVCGTPDGGGVEECVCAIDDFCCTVTWDTACVEIVEQFGCADCSDNNPDCVEPSACGPDAGDCCIANGTPGCDDVECCEQICAADPFCCETAWDQVCADAAIANCAVCAGVECDPPCGPDEVCVDGECVPAAANDNCEDAPVDLLVAGPGLSYVGDLTGATATCAALGAQGETWHAFSSTSTHNITTSHCGTSPVFGNAFIVIEPDCPCSGAFIFADTFDQTTCADGNWALHYVGVPAGDYWTPVILDPANGNDGPYIWNIQID